MKNIAYCRLALTGSDQLILTIGGVISAQNSNPTFGVATPRTYTIMHTPSTILSLHLRPLPTFVKILKSHLPSENIIYADLSGYRASDNPPSTIPPSFTVTTARPDIMVIERTHIQLLELTVPTNTVQNFEECKTRKESKESYLSLLTDLESTNYTADLATIEFGALGHLTKELVYALHKIIPLKVKESISKSLLELSKIAISCSAHVFNARLSTTWNQNTPLI